MAEPTYVSDLCYSALDLRFLNAAVACSDGIKGSGDLEVTETSPQSGSVTVAVGGAFAGKDGPSGDVLNGRYYAYWDVDTELVVPLNSTGSDREDAVWVQVCDADQAAVTSGMDLVYETDTTVPPAIPTDGCFYYLLATLTIPNGVGTGGGNVTNAMITDEREVYTRCGA